MKGWYEIASLSVNLRKAVISHGTYREFVIAEKCKSKLKSEAVQSLQLKI